MRNHGVTISGLLLVILTSVAQAEQLPAGAKPLSSKETEALYSGNTKVFPKSSFYYAPDHTFRGAALGKPVSGKWSVNANQFCMQNNIGAKDCWKWWSDGSTKIALWVVRSYGNKLDEKNDYSSDEINHLQPGDHGTELYKQAGGQ
jgi:hypothetical protein